MSTETKARTTALKVLIGLMLLSLMGSALAACGNSGGTGSTPKGKIKPVLLTATTQAGSMSVPLNMVQQNRNTRFVANTAAGRESFMVYMLDGQAIVRASVCVPCGSQSFSLQGNTLICDTCGTLFDAATGKGKSGVRACMSYPKAQVPYQITNGNIVMKDADLLSAFQKTLNP